MKRLVCVFVMCILLASLFLNVASAEGQRVYLSEIDLSVTFPEDYLVYTQSMDDDDPLLASIGLTAAELREALVSLLHNAEAYSVEDPDIMIYVNGNYNTITDFSNLSDSMLDMMAERMNDVAESNGLRVESYQWYKVNGRTYLVMEEQYFGISSDCYAYHFYTIHNNMAYNFALIDYSGKVSDHDREMMKAMVDSAVYGKDDEPAANEEVTGEFYSDKMTGASFSVPGKWTKNDDLTNGRSMDVGYVSPDGTNFIVYYSKDLWGELDSPTREMVQMFGFNRNDYNWDLFTADEAKELVSSAVNKTCRIESTEFRNYGRNRYYIVNGSVTDSDYMSNMDIIFNTKITFAFYLGNGYLCIFIYSDAENSYFYPDFEMVLEQFVPPSQN